jgi:cystathionine beta-lyase family protein involved in aluminum resistance
MNQYIKEILYNKFEINNELVEYVDDKEKLISHKFQLIDGIKEYNQYKVIAAMQECRLSSTDFHWTSGYGYGDVGRDKAEQIYSKVFNTEDALVRPTIVSGTHAITLALSALLKPGDELLYITGTPYDTLLSVIGLEGDITGTLMDYGVAYNELPLENNKIQLDLVKKAITSKTKMVGIQRSTGYSDRRALTIDEIEEAVQSIRDYNSEVIIFVDNCYGEFLEMKEPTDVGVDIMAGSLIKNPGGGIALSGGYVVGRSNLIKQVANRSTAPGIGKECGLTFGTTRTTLQGLFLAPHIVSEAVKGALLVAIVYSNLGFRVVPAVDDKKSDIIQGVELLTGERVVEFCKGIQSASAVDSYITPEPWEMPGYEDKVVMAAGGFIEGSSIELSADGPMREPYFAYYQGGLTYEHCKLGVLKSMSNLYAKDLIKLK